MRILRRALLGLCLCLAVAQAHALTADAMHGALRAKSLLEGAAPETAAAHDRLALALAHIDGREWQRARAALEEGMAVGRQVGDPYIVAVCRGYVGLIDCACGVPARGVAELGESLETVSWGVCASLFRGFLGGALASLERVDRATELLDHAERELEAVGSPLLLEAVHLQRGLLELALARRAETAADAARAAALRRAAQARMAAVTSPKAGVFGYNRATSIRDITDGTSNTIAVISASNAGRWAAGGK